MHIINIHQNMVYISHLNVVHTLIYTFYIHHQDNQYNELQNIRCNYHHKNNIHFDKLHQLMDQWCCHNFQISYNFHLSHHYKILNIPHIFMLHKVNQFNVRLFMRVEQMKHPQNIMY